MCSPRYLCCYLLLLQHPLQLSTLLQDYITTICSCNDITVVVIVTSCTDKTAMYNVWLTGVMATEAALVLITSIQNMTEGLNLGIVTLFLQEDGTCSELNCDNQKIAVQPEMSPVITTLSVITAMLLLILILIAVVYLR